jgi:DNA-binding Lrp family transcriptional regulator
MTELDRSLSERTEKHGRITRREGSELCRITPPQAYRLLDHLVGEGLMVREGGRGRTVGYRKPVK